nr:zinc finger BED domain-containing protein DAYSLEEPER-like [Quercus suber]
MALARMTIVDELPFRFVEHGGFIDFMAEVEPRFEVPSCVTVARDCLRLYIREKESLRKGIDHIFTIIFDNASSNDVAIDYLRRKTKDRVGSLLGCEFLHMHCFAHILNLIVYDGLKDLNESIVNVRNVVRWNSIYLMLENAKKFVAAFERIEDDDGHFLHYFEDPSNGPPRFLDWENVRLFTKFLGMLYETTLRFFGSLFVTTNVYFHELINLQDQLNQLCNGRGDPLLKGMTQRMKLKYDKYWGTVDRINLMLFGAIVVDPRYKL